MSVYFSSIFNGQNAPDIFSFHPEKQAYTLRGPSQKDQYHHLWRQAQGNFIATAVAGNPSARCGWMVRATTAQDAAFVALYPWGVALRRLPGGEIESLPVGPGAADLLQVERAGSRWVFSVARQGQALVSLTVENWQPGESVQAGLFVESGVAEVAFHNVRWVVPAGPGFERGRDPFASHLEVLELESGLRRVIYSQEDVFEAPNWTLDGAALIYNQAGRLYRFDLASRTITPIDTGDVIRNNNDHVISFDGQMLAISSHTGPEHLSLVYTVPLTGGQPRLVTQQGPSYLHGWSPDGRFVVYTALRDGDYDIYRIGVDGGPETRLTTAPGLDDGPEYTPDGQYIYFNSVRTGQMQIWRMKADGTNQEQLTHDDCNNWFPHISPEGKSVLFISYLPGEVDPGDHPAARRVYLREMALDGGTPRVLAYLYGGQGTINVPSWSPDGRQVAFVSNSCPW